MARRVLLLAAAVLLPAAPALGLEGKVVLSDGSPVAGATVSIMGRAGVTRTDAQGRFTWKPDPAPPFRVLEELPGGQYAAPVLVESIPPEGPVVITVTPLATEAVTVTAAAAPHIEAPPASAVGLLAREDLEQRHPQRLADALENVPGVGRVGGGHEAVPAIRGLARGRTLILLDGARVTTERRAGPSAGYLDPFFLEAIEISRGPGSVAYGSDAIGGIIHARTRQAEPGSPLRARAAAGAGTGVPETSAGAELSKGLAGGGMIFQARFRRFGDYDSPDGEVPNSEAADHGWLGRLDHEAGHGRLTVSWQTDLGRDTERPTSDSGTNRVSQPREDSRRLTFSYQMDPLANGTLIGVNGVAGSYRLATELDRLDGAALLREVFTSDVHARDFGLRAHAARPLPRARLEAGMDLNGRYGLEAIGASPLGEERAIEAARRAGAALYLTGEASPRSGLALSAGLRYDRVSTRNQGGFFGDRSTHEGAVSGFASVTGGPFHGLSVTGQVARGFRDPTLSDRYFAGISGRGFVTGEPDLQPETSFQIDAALRFTSRRARAALYLYDYRLDDLIERFQVGQDPSSGFDAFFLRNRGEGRLSGAELEVQADLADRLAIELGAQAARGEAEDGSDLDDIPPEGLTLQVRRGLGEGGYLQARAGFFARDDDPGPTESETPSHATLDLGGGWRAGRRLELRLQVRNLFDREHPSSPDRRAVLAAGRSALLTLVASVGG